MDNNAGAREWRYHLSGLGRRALQGQAVEISAVELSDSLVAAADSEFLSALEAVLSSATNSPAQARPGLKRILPLDEALASYVDTVAWQVGIALYKGDEHLAALFEETRGARDALRILAPSHWNRAEFLRAVLRAETRVHSKEWKPKFAGLSLLHIDFASRAA